MADDKVKVKLETSLAQFIGQQITPKLIDDVRKSVQSCMTEAVKDVINKDTLKVLTDTSVDKLTIRIGINRTPELTAVVFKHDAMGIAELVALPSNKKNAYILAAKLAEMGYDDSDEMLYPKGYAGCVVGVAPSSFHNKQCVLLVSREKVIKQLMDDDEMSEEDAVEFYDFNIAGAYMGEGTPIFVETLT